MMLKECISAKFFFARIEHQNSQDNLNLKFTSFWSYIFCFCLSLDFLTQALIGAH